jgi:uncharacterized protein with GYD domain
MASYVSLLKFTEKGVQNFKASPDRVENFKQSAKKLGVEVKEVFWLLGEYDGLLVFEAADDQTATACMLQLAALGNVTTRTSRAFALPEIKAIVGKAAG